MPRRLAGALAIVATLALAAPAAQADIARPTDRWLVVMEQTRTARSASLLHAVTARAGVQRAGPGAARLGIVTVRGPRAAIRRLRRDPAVAAVSREWVRELRRVPDDPALATPEQQFAVPAGTPIQWALARQRFPAAWDVTTGAAARVAILDTGVDATHPELAGKIISAETVGTADPASDPDGHGTHVAGLACAATDNRRGVAGAGWGCRLHVVKLGINADGGIRDETIVRGLELAMARNPHAIAMAFGGGPDSAALDAAIQAAYDRGIVLVAAAANDGEGEAQGAPASQLQPGNASDIDAGRGLVVTAADFSNTRAGTGRGSQISLAAYGFFDETRGPPGLISTFPAQATLRDVPDCMLPTMPGCNRRTIDDGSYAYLEGTSMATPQVAALAALVGALNPHLTIAEKLRLIKETARGSGAWNPELGWGILDAGAAVDAARRVDRTAPSSRVRAVRRRGRKVRLALRAVDRPGLPGLLPSRVKWIELYGRRGRRPARRLRRVRNRRAITVRLRRGLWRLHTRARDAAGNAEPPPARPDARLRVRPRPRR
jgi:serine protease